MPTCRERTGFRFAIADDTGGDQVGVIENGSESMQQRKAKLSALAHEIGDGNAFVEVGHRF